MIGSYVEICCPKAAFLKWLFLFCWLGKLPRQNPEQACCQKGMKQKRGASFGAVG